MIIKAFLGKDLTLADKIEVRMSEAHIGNLIEYDPRTGIATLWVDSNSIKGLTQNPKVISIHWKCEELKP